MSNVKIKIQIPYATGKFDIACPDCGKKITVTISDEKESTFPPRAYRNYRASCTHCRIVFTGIRRP